MRIVDGSRDLRWTRLDDGAERVITRTPDREESWPSWSEPARRLVFQVTGGRGRGDLLQWSPAGGEAPLATSQRDERWAAWSPVAARLAYAFVGGPREAGLVLVDLDTGSSRTIAEAGRGHFLLRPSWAPDGSRLLVQRRSRAAPVSRLRLVDPDGASRPLLDDPSWSDTKAWFTRDGGRIVFTREPAGGGPADVWSVAPDGSDPRPLAGGADSREHSGRPSPTRDELAFVSDRDGSPQVWLMGLDGAAPRRLTSARGAAFAPRWSPDGELLVVSVSRGVAMPRLADRAALAGLRLIVIDRRGRRRFETVGLMPDWMPAWR